MNSEHLRKCLTDHLGDKFRGGSSVAELAWIHSAQANHQSAMAIVRDDPNGAMILLWSCFQKMAKSLVARCGCSLDGETHGKTADFLRCCFTDSLKPRDLDLLQLLRADRNTASYDTPDEVNPRLLSHGFALARTMLDLLQPETSAAE